LLNCSIAPRARPTVALISSRARITTCITLLSLDIAAPPRYNFYMWYLLISYFFYALCVSGISPVASGMICFLFFLGGAAQIIHWVVDLFLYVPPSR